MDFFQNRLSLCFAKLFYQPLLWVMGVLARVAAVETATERQNVIGNRAEAVGVSQGDPMVHMGGVKKTQEWPFANCTAAVEVVERKKPVFGGKIGGKRSPTRSPSLSTHLHLEWIFACTLRICCALSAAIIGSASKAIGANGKLFTATLALHCSTLVERVIFASVVFGEPVTKALRIAEITMLVECPGDHNELPTALPAFGCDTMIVRTVFTRHIGRFPFAPTGAITEMVLSSDDQASFTRKRLAAMGAIDICAVVVSGFFARVKSFVTRVGAWATTVVFLVLFGGASFAGKRLSAFGANQIDLPNRLGLTLTRLASRCKAILFRFVALKVLSCGGKMLLAEVALLKWWAWGIMGLHVESPFDVPRPRVLAHRWDNCLLAPNYTTSEGGCLLASR